MSVLIIIGIIAVIALIIVCIIIDEVRVITTATLCIAKLIVALFVKGWGNVLFVYAGLSAIHMIIMLGTDCFNSDTKGTWIPRKDGKGLQEDINHPIGAFIGSLFAITIVLLVEYALCYFSGSYLLFPIVSGIMLILDIIALINVFCWS